MHRGASHALPSVLAAVPRAVVSVGACIRALAEAGGEQAAAASDGLLHPLPGRATSAPGLGAPLHKPAQSHICAGTALTPPLPHLHRDWAHPCHICTRIGLSPCHTCLGTGPAPSTSAPGLCWRSAGGVLRTALLYSLHSHAAGRVRDPRAATARSVQQPCELSACLAMRGAWHPLRLDLLPTPVFGRLGCTKGRGGCRAGGTASDGCVDFARRGGEPARAPRLLPTRRIPMLMLTRNTTCYD